MSGSRANPFTPESCSSTLFIHSVFLAANTLHDVKKVPERGDTQAFDTWFNLFKEWLAVYIRKTRDGLSSIEDITRRIELNDVLKASLKPSEAQDVEVSFRKIAEDFKKIQDMRSAIREQNSKFNDSYLKSGTEVLTMSANQPTIGHSQPMVRMLDTQNTSEKQLSVSVNRVRELEERLRVDAKAVYESLTRRVTADKLREIEEKVKAQEEMKTPTTTTRLEQF